MCPMILDYLMNYTDLSMTKKITLAIETTVGCGSLSLFENDSLTDYWYGEDKISRSDRLLVIIAEFLRRNKIEKKDLDLIAVSCGPGSFTGTRVGLATAAGLKNGLRISCMGLSILSALYLSASQTGNVIAAFLTDRNEVIREKFDNKSKVFSDRSIFPTNIKSVANEPEILSLNNFLNELNLIRHATEILLERKLYELIKDKVDIGNATLRKNVNIKNVGDNLSFFIGRAVMKNTYASDNFVGIYLDSNKKHSK